MALEEIEEFLKKEAELLDDRKFEEWLELLSDNVEYYVPVRSTHGNTEADPDNEFIDLAHVDDSKHRLEKRVERLDTEYAWAEQPPSRTRHFVSNVRVSEHEDGKFEVKSNLLLYVTRGDAADPTILSGERHDVISRRDSELRLTERTVYLDNTTLPLDRISVFI